jgi:hypothetical protein
MILSNPGGHSGPGSHSTPTSWIRAAVAIVFACTAMAMLPVTASARETEDDATFQKAMENLGKNIADYLKEKKEMTVGIGAFDGPGDSTAGRSIRESLSNELKKHDVTVATFGAKWKLVGDFKFESKQTFAIVLVNVYLKDENNSEVTGFRQRIQSEKITAIEDITRLLGINVDLVDETKAQATSGTADEDKEPNKDLSDSEQRLVAAKRATEKDSSVISKVETSKQKPSFALAGDQNTQLAAKDNSPFRMEMLVSRGGNAPFAPVAIKNSNGIPFVDDVQAGDVYKVKVYNGADHDIAVKLSVDGINCFALCNNPVFKEQGTWLVRAGQAGSIDGWFIDPAKIAPFVLTTEESVAGLPPADVKGTVTVQVFHAWGADQPTPLVERAVAGKGGLRTGAGPEISKQSKISRSFFGKTMLASLSLRYAIPDDLP